MQPASASFNRPLRWFLALALGHFLLSLLAIQARSGFVGDSMFWGLAGFSSAVLAQAPLVWRRVGAVAVFVSGGVSYLIFGAPFPMAIGFAAANAVQAFTAGGLLRRHLPQGRRIVRLRDIGSLAMAAVVSASVGAGVGALTAWAETGSLDGAVLGTWFMANSVGILVGAPVILALFSMRRESPPAHRWVPVLVVAAVTGLVFAGAIWASGETGRNFSYLLIVPVMISAVWLGQRPTALLVGVLAVAVALATSRGSGPFAATESSFDPLLAAQLFMSVVQLTALTVGVEASRRRDVIAELDGILAATVEGVLVIDETGTIRHTNAGSEAILAARPGELAGRRLDEFVPMEEVDDQETLHLSSARRSDGSPFWAEISRGAIYERSGRKRTAVVVRDVTGRIETEERVRQIQNEFVSNMTHELKTPLTAIIGFSDWLLAEPDSPTLTEDLTTIRDSALSMKTLIDDILDFKRVAGAEGAREAVDLRTVVMSSVDMVSPAAVDKLIEISLNLDVDPTVTGDRDQLGHAVQNLLSNAVKYSNPGGRVDVELTEEDGTVVLSVADQGIGIPEADLERLFERFFRAGNAGEIHGTGLGLALVRQVVERHGGGVELSSALGRGTRVCLTLPAERSPDEAGESREQVGHDAVGEPV